MRNAPGRCWLVTFFVWCLFSAAAFAQTPSSAASAADDDFHYNRLWTTKYGPAAADIIVKPSNMMSCKPAAGSGLSYALCY